MASHGIDWTPSVHVRFGSLDFLTMTDPAPVRPPRSASLDAAVEALEKLQLHTPEAHAPGGN
jgi:hypothetical protein